MCHQERDQRPCPQFFRYRGVALIPKVEGAVDVIAKILVKRLATVMLVLIGETQATLSITQILDEALIANEMKRFGSFKKTNQKVYFSFTFSKANYTFLKSNELQEKKVNEKGK